MVASTCLVNNSIHSSFFHDHRHCLDTNEMSTSIGSGVFLPVKCRKKSFAKKNATTWKVTRIVFLACFAIPFNRSLIDDCMHVLIE